MPGIYNEKDPIIATNIDLTELSKFNSVTSIGKIFQQSWQWQIQ